MLKKSKMVDMVGMVDPAGICALGCGNPTERSRSLAARFKNAKAEKKFLGPYNSVSTYIYHESVKILVSYTFISYLTSLVDF